MAYRIDRIVLRMLRLPLKRVFVSSFGSIDVREVPIIQIEGAGITGWGEASAMPWPYFNHETPETAYLMLKRFLIPAFLKIKPSCPQNMNEIAEKIKGNKIALAALENAFWDWHAKLLGKPLYKLIGGVHSKVPTGVSLGAARERDELFREVSYYIKRRYHRVKLKIMPGCDYGLLKSLKEAFPNLKLMVDANGAYDFIKDKEIFKMLDGYALLMIEQPFKKGEYLAHAKLAAILNTPICLDESIEELSDLELCAKLKACSIVNIKVSRVGGIGNSIRLAKAARKIGMGVWVGAMLDTAIGRAVNRAVASLPEINYPGDIYEAGRHYETEIANDGVGVDSDGFICLSDRPGIGIEVDMDAVDRLTQVKETFR